MPVKWIYHKERCFASNYFIILKILFHLQDSLIKSWYDVPTTQMSIFIFFVSAEVLFEGAISLWVSLHKFLSKSEKGPYSSSMLISSDSASGYIIITGPIYFLTIIWGQCFTQIETSQLICSLKQLTDCYMSAWAFLPFIYKIKIFMITK